MPLEPTKQIDRSRSILANLLRQVTPDAREAHYARLADAYQEVIDAVLATIDAAPPVSMRLPKARASKPPTEPASNGAHVHSATCEHMQEATTGAESATVPGAIRCVLANERDGLSARAIIAGVLLLRPRTADASIYGALHQMKKRSELVRIGANGKLGYALNQTFDKLTLTIAESAPANGASVGTGGEAH